MGGYLVVIGTGQIALIACCIVTAVRLVFLRLIFFFFSEQRGESSITKMNKYFPRLLY